MPASRSSTYRVPLTTVPWGADGVIVTGIVTDWPGPIVVPSMPKLPSITPAQKSANGVLTEVSIVFVETVSARLADPDGGVVYGPHSDGWANQKPAVTLPPTGA